MAIITSIPVLGGRDYLRPLAWRSKACIICHHALGGCWLSVQFSYGHSFRWVGRGHGVTMAGMFRLRVVPALGGTNGWGCRFSGPHASCSSGGRYLHALLASGMGSHLAVRGLFATMPGLIWHALHRSQFWVAETILRPHAWRSKACIICHHALGGCCFSVQCSSGRLFRWVGHGHGVAMAGGSGCGWCRLLGVPTYRHTAIWALEGFVPVGCVIVGYCLSRYIVFGCTGSVTAIIPA